MERWRSVCLESTTSFASFEDKEGIIRIWYTNDGNKVPVLMEFDLPVGNVKFELDEIREGIARGIRARMDLALYHSE